MQVTGNSSLDMILMRVNGAKDDMSSKSKNYRDAMEAMHQMAMEGLQMLMGIAQVVMKVLGTISG